MPLPVSNHSLVTELRATVIEIDKQIEAARKAAEWQQPIHAIPDETLVYRQMDRNGNFVLVPLLLAKAECLAAIARLQEKR